LRDLIDLPVLAETHPAVSNLAIFALALAVIVAWYVIAVAVVIWRRFPRPPTVPATNILGAEPPAVVNLLTSGFDVTPDAVPATLLDLAARHLLEIEELQPGRYVCRLPDVPAVALSSYEQQVWALLVGRTVRGIVPTEALTTGPRGAAAGWSKRFTSLVIHDARARGLSRPFWDSTTTAVLGLLAGASAALVVLSVNSDHQDVTVYTPLDVLLSMAAWATLGALALSAKFLTSTRQRATPAGLVVAGRWIGLKTFLASDPIFPSLPPTAVTIWNRYLAYGAALGVAGAAVRAVPMGAEDDHRAWSSVGGRWRQLQIRYPHFWPPSWGWHPLKALLFGLVSTIITGAILRLIIGAMSQMATGPHMSGAILVLFLVAGGVGAGDLFVGAAAIVLMVHSIEDLLSRAPEVTGQVLRLRQLGSGSENGEKLRYYVAADDGGSSKRVFAWRLKRELYESLTEYKWVRASVSQHLRYVSAISPTDPPLTNLSALADIRTQPGQMG